MSNSFRRSGIFSDSCVKCGKRVVTLERLEVREGMVLHGTCFKCETCGQQLTVSNYETFKELFYCTKHYYEIKKHSISMGEPIDLTLKSPRGSKQPLVVEEQSKRHSRTRLTLTSPDDTPRSLPLSDTPPSPSPSPSPSLSLRPPVEERTEEHTGDGDGEEVREEVREGFTEEFTERFTEGFTEEFTNTSSRPSPSPPSDPLACSLSDGVSLSPDIHSVDINHLHHLVDGAPLFIHTVHANGDHHHHDNNNNHDDNDNDDVHDKHYTDDNNNNNNDNNNDNNNSDNVNENINNENNELINNNDNNNNNIEDKEMKNEEIKKEEEGNINGTEQPQQEMSPEMNEEKKEGSDTNQENNHSTASVNTDSHDTPSHLAHSTPLHSELLEFKLIEDHEMDDNEKDDNEQLDIGDKEKGDHEKDDHQQHIDKHDIGDNQIAENEDKEDNDKEIHEKESEELPDNDNDKDNDKDKDKDKESGEQPDGVPYLPIGENNPANDDKDDRPNAIDRSPSPSLDVNAKGEQLHSSGGISLKSKSISHITSNDMIDQKENKEENEQGEVKSPRKKRRMTRSTSATDTKKKLHSSRKHTTTLPSPSPSDGTPLDEKKKRSRDERKRDREEKKQLKKHKRDEKKEDRKHRRSKRDPLDKSDKHDKADKADSRDKHDKADKADSRDKHDSKDERREEKEEEKREEKKEEEKKKRGLFRMMSSKSKSLLTSDRKATSSSGVVGGRKASSPSPSPSPSSPSSPSPPKAISKAASLSSHLIDPPSPLSPVDPPLDSPKTLRFGKEERKRQKKEKKKERKGSALIIDPPRPSLPSPSPSSLPPQSVDPPSDVLLLSPPPSDDPPSDLDPSPLDYLSFLKPSPPSFDPIPLLPSDLPSPLSALPLLPLFEGDKETMEFLEGLGKEKEGEEGKEREEEEEEEDPLHVMINHIEQEVEKAEAALQEFVEKGFHNAKKISLGAIGLSDRLLHLLSLILSSYPHNVKLLALFDPSPDLVHSALQRYGEVRKCESEKELLEMEQIDWVLIGAPAVEHYRHIKSSLTHNKHIFCENAVFGFRVEEFKEIIEKTKLASKYFATSFPLRHSPFFLKLFSILRSGELGEIISIDCNQMIVSGETSYLMTSENRYRSKIGSMFLEKSAPMIDIICWLLQSIPMKVASFGGLNAFTPSHLPSGGSVLQRYTEYRSPISKNPFTIEKDIEDNQVAIVEFQNAARATIHLNCNSPLPQTLFTICCLNGTIQGDYIKGTIDVNVISSKKSLSYQLTSGLADEGNSQKMLNNFIDAILSGNPPPISALDSVISAFTAMMIDKARIEESVIHLSRLWRDFNLFPHL